MIEGHCCLRQYPERLVSVSAYDSSLYLLRVCSFAKSTVSLINYSQDSSSQQASQLAGVGEARQKRAREGAGLTGSARLAGAPRICLSPHFSRSGIWTSAQRNPRFHAHRQSIPLWTGGSTSIGMLRACQCDRRMENTTNTTPSLRILKKPRDRKDLR
jgi:hypothetical protein